MTDQSRLSDQIKMEADEVLFDGVHFDTRLKDRVRELSQQQSSSSQAVTSRRRWPWLQLSMVAAVFAVVILGSRGPAVMKRAAQTAPVASAAPSLAAPKGAADTAFGGVGNKVENQTATKAIAAPEAAVTADTVTIGQATEGTTAFTVKVTATSLAAVEYQLKAELPQAPMELKTAAEAWDELRKMPVSPEKGHGRSVAITKVELVQRPLAAGQNEKGELCYLFSGSFEDGTAFSQYIYAEKGKMGGPQ